MGAYLKPIFALARELLRSPGERRAQKDLERRVQLYEACIREGRDPYSDPELTSPSTRDS